MGQLDYTIRPIEEINDRQGRADFFGELAVLRSLTESYKRRYTLIRVSGRRCEKSAYSDKILPDAMREAERTNYKYDPYVAIEIKGEIRYMWDVKKIKDNLLELVQQLQFKLAEETASREVCVMHDYMDKVEVCDFNIEKTKLMLNKIKSYDLWKN